MHTSVNPAPFNMRILNFFVRAMLIFCLFGLMGFVLFDLTKSVSAYAQKTYQTADYFSGETDFGLHFIVKVTPLDNNLASLDTISVWVAPPGLISCNGSVANVSYQVSTSNQIVDKKSKVLPSSTFGFIPGAEAQTFTLYSASPGHGYIVSQGHTTISFGALLSSDQWSFDADPYADNSASCDVNSPKMDNIPIGGQNGHYDNPAAFVITIPQITSSQPTPVPTATGAGGT